jgi:CheY-like chemotaxis protein
VGLDRWARKNPSALVALACQTKSEVVTRHVGFGPTTVCVLLLYLAKIMRKALQILAVEDEKAVAQILAVVLGGPMAKVIRAADGWEALIKVGAAARPFDVVITDHRMPRMGGLELVRRLRTRNFEGKILVLSAHLSDEDISAYEEFGVDMMMSKPFDFEEIQNAVAILTKGASVAVAA